jgi:hypothetical protein
MTRKNKNRKTLDEHYGVGARDAMVKVLSLMPGGARALIGNADARRSEDGFAPLETSIWEAAASSFCNAKEDKNRFAAFVSEYQKGGGGPEFIWAMYAIAIYAQILERYPDDAAKRIDGLMKWGEMAENWHEDNVTHQPAPGHALIRRAMRTASGDLDNFRAEYRRLCGLATPVPAPQNAPATVPEAEITGIIGELEEVANVSAKRTVAPPGSTPHESLSSSDSTPDTAFRDCPSCSKKNHDSFEMCAFCGTAMEAEKGQQPGLRQGAPTQQWDDPPFQELLREFAESTGGNRETTAVNLLAYVLAQKRMEIAEYIMFDVIPQELRNKIGEAEPEMYKTIAGYNEGAAPGGGKGEDGSESVEPPPV